MSLGLNDVLANAKKKAPPPLAIPVPVEALETQVPQEVVPERMLRPWEDTGEELPHTRTWRAQEAVRKARLTVEKNEAQARHFTALRAPRPVAPEAQRDATPDPWVSPKKNWIEQIKSFFISE